MKDISVAPPDGGYGWVVVTSAFFCMGLTTGIMRNFGMFFLDIQNHYGVLTSTVSWITSTCIAVFHLGAPLARALSVYLTHCGVMMIGAMLAALGMIIGSLGLGIPWMYFSIGVLEGLGCSFCWMVTNSMVSRYFKRWRPIAFSISSSGECVFSMAFSPLFQWLIEAYSWRGALLITGGLQLNLLVCGALMRPLKPNPSSPNPSQKKLKGDSTEQSVKAKKSLCQWSLICKPELLFYITFATFAASGFFIPALFLVPHVRRLNVEQYWAASLLSVLSLTDLLGRLACGWLANLRLLRNLQLLAIATIILGVVLLLLPLSQGYSFIVVFTALCGFLFGSVVAVHIISIVDIVGLEGFDSALSFFMLVRSTGTFISLPAAGWLVDWFDDFGAAFYMAGLCIVLSAVFIIMADQLVERRKNMTTAGTCPDPETEACPTIETDDSIQ